jgi:hypothetical protein
MLLPQQVLRNLYGFFKSSRNFCNIYCDSPRLVTSEQFGGRAIGKLLALAVANDKAGV